MYGIRTYLNERHDVTTSRCNDFHYGVFAPVALTFFDRFAFKFYRKWTCCRESYLVNMERDNVIKSQCYFWCFYSHGVYISYCCLIVSCEKRYDVTTSRLNDTNHNVHFAVFCHVFRLIGLKFDGNIGMASGTYYNERHDLTTSRRNDFECTLMIIKLGA